MKRPNTWPSHTSARQEPAQGVQAGQMTEQGRLKMVYRYIQHPEEVSEQDMENMWDLLGMRIRESVESEEEYVLIGQEDWT
jgi:hypothetical protein